MNNSGGSDAPTCPIHDLVRSKLGNPDDPVFSEEEAAEYPKMSRRSLQRIRARGGVPYIRYLREVFYRQSFLDEYVVGSERPAERVRSRMKRKPNQEA